MDPLKESPLSSEHEALGARMIGFAGWRMPVQYQGIIPEHQAVRERIGVFDISHMGQVAVNGPLAEKWLNGLLTNDVASLENGQGQYTLMLNDRGGVIDDLILYRQADERFFLVINAAKIDEDVAWLQEHVQEGVQLDDLSAEFAGMAVQGPDTEVIAGQLFSNTPLPQRNGIATYPSLSGEALICRTGYTGEDGFELFAPIDDAVSWWRRLIDLRVTPCGLGARDTLRLEMGYPLNGSDLTPDRTPLEAGLGYFVSLKKPAFIGREILLQQKDVGLASRLAALQMDGPGPPLRSGYAILEGGTRLGEIASGCLSPSLKIGIAMAYLPPGCYKPGRKLEVEIRGKHFPLTTVKKPFYRKDP